MRSTRWRAAIAPLLIYCSMLSACGEAAPPQEPAPAPEPVVLAIPDRYLADIAPHPMLRGATEADVAVYIAEFGDIVHGARQQLAAARRVQECHRALIAGEIEECAR